jgi:hypothetical protein
VLTTLRGAIFVLALVPASAGQAVFWEQSPNPSGGDLDFVDKHLVAARDRLMPMRGLEHREFIAYRGSKDQFTDMSELHFAITFAEGQMPSAATLTTLTGGSVRQQLIKLRLADREASLDVLLLNAGVRRTKLTPDRCSELQHRIDDLMKVSIVMIRPRNVIRLHPVIHEIVMSRNGTYLDTHFDDPAIGLVSWALDTLNALKTCEAALLKLRPWQR